MREKQLSQSPAAIKQREWRHSMTPEKRAAYLAMRRDRFAKYGVEEQREYRKREPEKATARAKNSYWANPVRARAFQKKYREQVKAEVFAFYGGSCSCCGEDELAFLTIDHIVPVRSRTRTRAGSSFYYKLKMEGFPPGYQVLCFNCNCAKRTNPVCPHKARNLKLVTAPRDL
jgi:hypothetical protein